MCSRQPDEGAGADRVDADSPWTHTPHTLPADEPRWVKRAVNGGWDRPQEEVSNDR
jgi:hypothetical protein